MTSLTVNCILKVSYNYQWQKLNQDGNRRGRVKDMPVRAPVTVLICPTNTGMESATILESPEHSDTVVLPGYSVVFCL